MLERSLVSENFPPIIVSGSLKLTG